MREIERESKLFRNFGKSSWNTYAEFCCAYSNFLLSVFPYPAATTSSAMGSDMSILNLKSIIYGNPLNWNSVQYKTDFVSKLRKRKRKGGR